MVKIKYFKYSKYSIKNPVVWEICREPKRKKDVDHIIPVQMGGELFNKDNLRTLCKECHKAKSRLDSWALK